MKRRFSERKVPLEDMELARKIAELAADKQATDVVLLDTRKACSFADYFVICSGESERQIEAVCNAIDEAVKEANLSRCRRQGTAGSGWVLIDMGNIIVHVFAPFHREYYQLESLWGHAPVIVRLI